MSLKQPSSPPVILVVEDEALVRMLAHDYFEDAGFEVLEAASGREALAVMTQRPDIRAVMTDVQMPGDPDGLELARTFRAHCPECAIIVASGRVMPRAAELASGAVFVSKPYVGCKVVKTMQELLSARC